VKAKVIAKIKNSPIIPAKVFTAEKIFDFDDNDNVFGRIYEARRYFREKYRVEDVELISCEWL